MCTYHLGNGISKQYRLDDDTAVKRRACNRERRRRKKKRKSHDSTDNDNMEQEGTNVKILGNSSDPDLPEDAEQARETDQAMCSEQGANDTDHEDSLQDSDQAVMDIDSDETASNYDQDESEKSFQTATDVNDSLESTEERSHCKEQCIGTPHRLLSLAQAMSCGLA